MPGWSGQSGLRPWDLSSSWLGGTNFGKVFGPPRNAVGMPRVSESSGMPSDESGNRCSDETTP